MEGLSVRIESSSSGDQVVLAGELDVDTVAALDKAIAGLDAPVVVLDLAEVTFCDSRALECLIRNKVVLRDDGRELRLARQSPTVERLLELTNTARFFEGA